MRLPRNRPATPKNPRITPEAKAEYNLLQQQALTLGQTALKQNGIKTRPLHDLPGGGTLTQAISYEEATEPIRLQVTIVVDVNPQTGAAIKLHP